MKKEMLENKIRSILHGVGHFLCSINSQEKALHHRGATFAHQNGITLIALVITIILMLILSAVVINVTLGENGLFKVAKYAVQKSNEETAKEKLQLALEDLRAHKYSSEDYNENEYIEDYLKNEGMNVSDNIVTVNKIAFEIDRENLTIIGRKQGYVIITSKLKERLENGFANILITIESDKEIESITFPNEDGTTLTVTTDKKTLSKDLKVEIGKEYQVTVKTKDEKEVTKIIKIEREKVRTIILNKSTLEIAKGSTDETLQATVLPADAEDKSVIWTSSDESIAKVIVSGDTITITAVKVGTANITATANDGSNKSASCKVTVTPPPPPELGGIGTTHTAKQIPDDWGWPQLGEIAKVISDNYGYEEGQINEDTAEVAVSYGGIETTIGIGDWTTVNGKKVRILGFNHDNLVTTTTNEAGETVTWAQYGAGTTNTKAGISFDFVDSLGKNPMNANREKTGGWETCDLRGLLNTNSNAMINTLENKAQIKLVVKEFLPGYQYAAVGETCDYLWLVSEFEILGKLQDTKCAEGKQYRYWRDDELKRVSPRRWLRSPVSVYGSPGFVTRGEAEIGRWCYSDSTDYAVCPGFSI